MDHPRSRGVYVRDRAKRFGLGGSSPLARGLRPVKITDAKSGRIIPARAGFTRRPVPHRTGPMDHPRSRGVYQGGRSATMRPQGSSPLARGLLAPGLHVECSGRIIPARAGFTVFPTHPCTDNRDHPRSRGVYLRPLSRRSRRPGSSPLARGLRRRPRRVQIPRRIIPARAGFTGDHDRGGRHPGDHPRSRGVYQPWTRALGPVPGSSPLARGLPLIVPTPRRSVGIIPARAGFTRR